MKRKNQQQQTLPLSCKTANIGGAFLFLTSLVVLVAIAIIGFMTVSSFLGVGKSTESAYFVKTLQNDISDLKLTGGSDVNLYALPDSVARIIILDLKKRDILMEHYLVKDDPLLLDSLQSNEGKNIFLYTRTGVYEASYYIGDIALGHLGETGCDGITELITTTGQITFELFHRKGNPVEIGSPCTDVTYASFDSPFGRNTIPTQVTRLEVSQNLQSITLKENINNPGTVFWNETLNSTEWEIPGFSRASVLEVEKEEYDNSKIRVRLGFKDVNGDYYFYGPNLSATTPDDEGYFYDAKTQFITPPFDDYINLKAEILFVAGDDDKTSPVLEGIKVTFREREMTLGICENAHDTDLCDALDFVFREGARNECCTQHLNASTHADYATCCPSP